MMRRVLFTALMLAAATNVAAKVFIKTEKATYELPMFIAGSFVLDNADGDIEIVGTDDTKATVFVTRTIRGVDESALADGLKMTAASFTGDERQRIVRTWISPMRTSRWAPNVSYVVRLPRTAQATIFSTSSTQIKISEMRGAVRVKNINGVVLLDHVTGPAIIESGNGNIIFNTPAQLRDSVRLETVNGAIQVNTPPGNTFSWIADSLRGDIRTTLPVQGRFEGSQFRGYLNQAGPATLITKSLLGNVTMMRLGATYAESVPVREMIPLERRTPDNMGLQRGLKQPLVVGLFQFATSMGDVVIGEIRGDTKIETGAGAVQLGLVTGECNVESNGGPINLGRIMGELNAKTAAGDIVVQQAREGGILWTGGGSIRLMNTMGPTRLTSGGGDIFVSTNSPVIAETRSGDITITMDRTVKSQRLNAKTTKGNVILNVGPNFAADIDATVLTSDPNVHSIRTDFGTVLAMSREQVGNKIRIRATGKVNGGGERVELFAEDGGIQLTTAVPR